MNSGSQPDTMDMPPMGMGPEMGNDMGGNFMPQGDMQQPPMQNMPMGDEMNDMPNQFDTNFDAGVEADEEQDPKKYIQQLTGKLSQSLQKYTDENGEPDVDLNKYVAGMITKQAMKGLSEEDAEEIIDKVKSDEDFQMEDGENDEQEQGNQMDNQMQAQEPNSMPQGDMQQPPMNENFSNWKRGKQIKEIVNGVLDKGRNEETPYQQPKNNGGYKTRVYTPRDFDM